MKDKKPKTVLEAAIMAGFETQSELVELSGVSRQCLYRYFKDDCEKFKTILYGSVLKRELRLVNIGEVYMINPFNDLLSIDLG